MRVGIISDTHNYLDPRALSLLEGVGHILHAGDIGNYSIISELEELAPVTKVRGNVDREGQSSRCPEIEILKLGHFKIYLTHELKPPKSVDDPILHDFQSAGIKIVVYGHSHIAYQQTWGGVLFFNPGAAGKKRFKVIPSIGLLELDESGIDSEIITL
ncbi:MAG: metallophosphoesterase family protein [Chloroflexota bacterium]|nr:metallophosphoesterase family protein [Chloroflexota bacterium]